MQEKFDPVDVWIGIKMVDACRVEGAGAADNAVHFVVLLEQQIGQVAAILAGDAGDQCFLHREASV